MKNKRGEVMEKELDALFDTIEDTLQKDFEVISEDNGGILVKSKTTGRKYSILIRDVGY